jgi:hypothetical protein
MLRYSLYMVKTDLTETTKEPEMNTEMIKYDFLGAEVRALLALPHDAVTSTLKGRAGRIPKLATRTHLRALERRALKLCRKGYGWGRAMEIVHSRRRGGDLIIVVGERA